jgi:hypothetical protein
MATRQILFRIESQPKKRNSRKYATKYIILLINNHLQLSLVQNS